MSLDRVVEKWEITHTHTQHKKALVKYDNKRNVNIDYDGVSCFLKHYALSLCIAYNDCC